jgi:cyclic pyranopterin phosphate synthase
VTATTVLRLSVTDRCNLRCRYCMPSTGVPVVPREALPSLEALAETAAWLARHAGVRRVKLTGGEPLVRRGVVTLVERLVAIPAVTEVSMTTNGTRLAELAAPLARAGLARVNVSLDTLDRDRFATLTRGGDVAATLAGIDAAVAAGLTPVKLNAVLRRSSWREDVPALLDFAALGGYELRFIELMRTGSEAEWVRREILPAGEVRLWLERTAAVEPVVTPAAAPARRTSLTWRGRRVVVGWVTPLSSPFCDRCDRLRLDARGRLRRCLMDARVLPLLELLGRQDDAVVLEYLRAYLAAKEPPAAMDTGTPMSGIGG